MDPPEEGKRPPSKAQRIRDLAAKRMSIAEIQHVMRSEGMPVSYQHVHNTLAYSRQLLNPEEAQKAKRAMVHHRDEGPRSLEERELLSEKKAKLKPEVERLMEELRMKKQQEDRRIQ